MRSAKSINSLSSQQTSYERRQPDLQPQQSKSTIGISKTSGGSPTSPICRCRVMYLGSSVPHITKDGLQGIQEPLRELYPDKATLASGDAGIDSWLSVWSNGILIENVDETGREIKRFFKIDALHYCAAVKYVSLPNININGNQQNLPKFLPLDSPHARQADSNPPVFASILRRTTGIKVLECHAFICKREAAANALVRCCFHAYADTMYAKQIGADINVISKEINNNQNVGDINSTHNHHQQPPMATKRSKSIAALNETDNNNNNRLEAWRNIDNNGKSNNHSDESHHRNLMNRRKSMNEHHNSNNCDNDSCLLDKNQSLYYEPSIKQQRSLSKSMHHLNDTAQLYSQQQLNIPMTRDQLDHYDLSSTSASCINIPNNNTSRWQQASLDNQVPLSEQPFYNPYAGRVPCYPPENIIDSGGTLKSIKSMAANSIASTLLRSKKQAKAMSLAQFNGQQQQNINKITSFHQPHSNNNSATIGGSLHPLAQHNLFLPNIPLPIINGSQTMKTSSSRPILPLIGPPMNFETMSPKEMKKLLKKSAKYTSKFCDNGLPLFPNQLPPPPPPILPPHNKSGTMISQGTMFSDIYGVSDVPDMGTFNGILPIIPPPPQLNHESASYQLVKPNPDFLKSKAGKKWLKEQKQFKKLLPPHLDVGNLPIIFGPPPTDANLLPPPPPPLAPNFIPQQQVHPVHGIAPTLPMLDSSGYYNPHPFYGQNGRASAASTLLRYSPQSQMIHNGNPIQQQHRQHQLDQHNQNELDYRNQNSTLYSNGLIGQTQPIQHRNHKNYENGSIIYSNAECNIDPQQQQQFVDNNESRYYHNHSDRRSSQNHMVEQSVISLGDENDYDDDEAGDEHNVNAGFDNQNEQNYENNQDWHQTDQRNINAMNHNNGNDHNADSQSNYSSGIYKRGNINERAFSYSIRQEQINSTGNNNIDDRDSCNIINNGNYHAHQNHQVNQLTARLENQLNMRSFANQSRVKSHN